MSEEKCGNIKSLDAFNIRSLCETCRHSHGCGYRFASDLIGELKTPGVRQEHIIVECHLYEKYKTIDTLGIELPDDHPVVGSLRPYLWEANVKDVCACCPSEVKDGCERHKRLDDLADTSWAAETWVQGQVVCCNQSERLYQISEPKR